MGRIKLLFYCLFFSCSITMCDAQGWGDWEEIYSDGSIRVEVQVYTSTNSCEGGKAFKFRSRVNGTYRSYDYYLIWKFDYVDCYSVTYTQTNSIVIGRVGGGNAVDELQESLDDKFTAAFYTKHYDYIPSTTKVKASIRKEVATSIAAKGIIGESKIYLSDMTTLSVNGGALGKNAQWVWYVDSCGGKYLDRGRAINVRPRKNTIYYVRAEGEKDTTSFVMHSIEVDMRSKPADRISAPNEMCVGESILLAVEGGSLGLGAEWVWFENNCGTKRIGTGSSITVSPKVGTTYFVRAEGRENITACVQKSISVNEKTGMPESIVVSGNNPLCEGESIVLRVNGGKLSKNARWKWYRNSCDGDFVGFDEKITVSPSYTTIYYVKGDGSCNTTNCLSTTIYVNNKSARPVSISKPYTVYKRKKAELSVVGGVLGKNAVWEWYTGGCGNGTLVGKGSTLTIKVNKPTTYYVRASGNCNQTSCVSILISPEKAHRYDKYYSSTNNKFFHYGLGFGFEWQQFSALTQSVDFNSNGTTTIKDSIPLDIKGFGWRGEFVIHPIIKEYFSLGFMAAYAGGGRSRDSATWNEVYTYSYEHIGCEIALGFKPVKLLLRLNQGFQSNNFKRNIVNAQGKPITTYTFEGDFNTEEIDVGLRLGRYLPKERDRGHTVDIVYNLMRPYTSGLWSESVYTSRLSLGEMNTGVGLAWWAQNIFRFKFDVIFNRKQKDFDVSLLSFDKATYRISAMLTLDRFY